MSIRILFMGVIATVTGQKDLVLEAGPGATLREVLDRLEARYGPEFGMRVFRSQTPPRPLQMHTRIFVNNELATDETLDLALPSVGPEQGAAEVLIYLMPAASGG
ncbi:MAG: MoaD/ThiS family protein [Candidatus Rokubacteria bacterium]|nr:MoaD/ThiS family protein [Candidatus Rokubacteria bacterium]MDP2625763.1 MoaD/ThiS family protein [Candidatus Rokubacteria bacterium]